MEQALATVRGDELGLAVSDVPAKTDKIDIGPFLRQEGRQPGWEIQSHSLREEVIKRLRIELDLPSEQSGRVIRMAKSRRPVAGIPLWMAGLVQRIRQPG